MTRFPWLPFKQLADGAEGLIDSYISVGGGAGVGIGNGDAAARFTTDFVRRLARIPLRIEERIVFIAITVRPTVNRDGFDVARRIEAAGTEATRELIANVALESFEGRYKQFHAAGFVLFASGKAGFARSSAHMEEDGFIG